ncbi:translation initiation factor IF-2 [Candidatus Kaiserbacteria bacterium]|nr:translation initiation factor IF-2 [Candidatus Kaiserbacteria bacterium]
MSKPASHIERPPIVVVMGHVDHGKSTLLDYIRKTNTVEKEAGGITQHVAAYEVERPSKSSGQAKRITFIDTPGHAAFQAIRARGASIADIAILVVAADDGVKPQTLEALARIKSTKIPYIVAINKIDKPEANIERTQASLMQEGIYLEKLGGDVPWTAISAKVGTGVDELLDLVLLVAELHELKGESEAPASGFVIEAHRDPKRGLAATLIITNGTLRSGMTVVAGGSISPVRIMEGSSGVSLREASFSTPVQLVGFDELPELGSEFLAYKGKREAEEARSQIQRTQGKSQKVTLAPEENSEHFVLPLIVRADAAGSLEAIEHEIVKLGDEYSSVRIVLSGIGNIAEGDVKAALAGSVQAVVIGFNVKVDPIAEEYARQHTIRIETFDIIYKLTERLEELLHEMRPKRAVEETLGHGKVLKQFSSRKDQHVVGGKVSEGYLARGGSVRVVRRGTLVGTGKIKNIQSHKADVDRVETGSEFGALITSAFEIVQGDTLECFTSAMK